MTRTASFALAMTLVAMWLALVGSGFVGADGYVLVPVVLATGTAGMLIAYRTLRLHPWAIIGLLVFSVGFLNVSFRTRDYGAAGLDWQNGIKLITWSFMALISAVHWRKCAALWGDPVMRLMFLFVGLALLSSVYSAVPGYSFACALSNAAYLGFACLLVDQFSEKKLILTMIWTMTGYLVLCLIAAAVAPDIAFFLSPLDTSGVLRLQGIASHPNALAQQAGVLICLAVGAHFRGYLRRASWPLVALGSITVIMSGSRTASYGLVLASILIALRARRLLLPGVSLMALVAGVAMTMGANLSWISRTGDPDELLTLTGRTELWSFAWEKIIQRPWLGHGFNSFEATVVDQWYGNPDAGVATHNNFLEVLFSCGIIGFLPFISALVILLLRWLRKPDVLSDLLVVYLVIDSFTEVDITSVATLPTIAWAIIIAQDARRGQRALPTFYAVQVRHA